MQAAVIALGCPLELYGKTPLLNPPTTHFVRRDCLVKSHLYTQRWVMLSDLIDVALCVDSDWCRNSQPIKGTHRQQWDFILHLSPQGPSKKMEQKDSKSQPLGRSGRKQCLLKLTPLLHSRAHKSCGCLHKTKPVTILGWKGWWELPQPTHEVLWTAGGFWEKESQFFFTGVAAGLLTMLRKAPHLWVDGWYKLETMVKGTGK